LDDETTIEQLKSSSAQLRDLQREQTRRGDYVAARSACFALRRVNQQLKAQTTFDSSKADVEQMICKRNELIGLVRSTTDAWNALVDGHAEETRARLDLLADTQDEELARFDRGVPTDLPPLMKRNSVAYHQMRSKQKYLAVTENFDEAIELQKRADALEARERQANFEKVELMYRGRRNRLQDHQDRLFSNTVEYAVLKGNEMKAQRDKAVRGQQNRIDGLEKQIVAKCESKGITQGEIRLDLVDEERLAVVRQAEMTNPVTPQACAVARNASRKSTSDSRAAERTASRRVSSATAEGREESGPSGAEDGVLDGEIEGEARGIEGEAQALAEPTTEEEPQ
jgi:hypothetical protein